jgi:Siphovirus ReqiPepy6 Gp37-like protein
VLLFILNPSSAVAETPGPYFGGALVDDYSSLVWTERYLDYGEFQLNIPAQKAVRPFYPGTLFGIDSSPCVMLAESQQESVNDEGYPEIVITGRSAESILENRVLWAPHGSDLTLARTYTYLDAALLYIWGGLLNGTTSDVGYTVARPAEISLNSKITDAILTDSSPATSLTPQKITVALGQVGPKVREFLTKAGRGIRCVRPVSNVDGVQQISVDPANGANKGLITRTPMSGVTWSLRFDVYSGIDHANPPPGYDVVYFSSEAGHLDDIDIKTTYKEFITNAVHSVDSTYYYGSSTPLETPHDFGVRHRYIDASQLVSGLTPPEYVPIITKDQHDFYQTHPNRAILDAKVTSGTPFVYGQHYNLGDLVMMRHIDRERRALVSEYTRIDDAEGFREFPGMIAFDDMTSGVLRDW